MTKKNIPKPEVKVIFLSGSTEKFTDECIRFFLERRERMNETFEEALR